MNTEIIDASRRPVKWLSLSTFAGRFGWREAAICSLWDFIFHDEDGQRYGAINLTDSPVTYWYVDKPRETLGLSALRAAIYAIDEPHAKLRLGDGIEELPERKEPHVETR